MNLSMAKSRIDTDPAYAKELVTEAHGTTKLLSRSSAAWRADSTRLSWRIAGSMPPSQRWPPRPRSRST